MPNKTPLLSDSTYPPTPPCRTCGGSTQLARIEPMGDAGQYQRTYECMTCEARFVIKDDSDEEIQQLAERMSKTKGAL